MLGGSSFAPAKAAEPKQIFLNVGGFQRSYSYFEPDAFKKVEQSFPVVLVLPDSGGDGATALKQFGWQRLAQKKLFVAVGLDPLPVDPQHPEMFQTNPGYWSDGSGRGNAQRGTLDDVAYVRAVLDDVKKRTHIDEREIFATGLGNGGSMTHLLGIALSNRLAAIAPVGGHLWSKDAPQRPLPVMMIVGASDPVDPPSGGMGLNVWTHAYERKAPAVDSAVSWAKQMGCAKGPERSTLASGVMQGAWSNCDGTASVAMLVVPGQGHHWPGGADDQLESLGPNGDALDATAYIWDWFAAHPKG